MHNIKRTYGIYSLSLTYIQNFKPQTDPPPLPATEYIFFQQQYVYDIAGNVQDTVKIIYCICDKLCILYWGLYCGI